MSPSDVHALMFDTCATHFIDEHGISHLLKHLKTMIILLLSDLVLFFFSDNGLQAYVITPVVREKKPIIIRKETP